MFSSSSLEKSCINSDSCPPARTMSNASNRVSLGVPPLCEDNQQIRIQLAVNKYNGLASGTLNNRCSLVRHSFLKNSLKVRNYEGDNEGTSKSEKKKGSQYEGVGAFPTIHLKKSAVRYRPIKRIQDVKIPYPELPVNRFLNQLPEVCPELKSCTRSVLDVLEDLSGNKVHSKDENGSGRSKLKGLGGDSVMNSTSVYKPLFVQKPTLSTVVTRDNTTQTLSPVSTEVPSPQSSSSFARNNTYDPRVELRRKLAKQNNEIFASLSSSISSNFSLKRKIDKVLPSKEDGLFSNGSAQKKTRTINYSENGVINSVNSSGSNSIESVKLSRKSKIGDTNPVSPNKDRLTAIFLDTRNTSPKAQVFQANTTTDSNKVEKAVNKPIENGDKTENSLTNGSSISSDKVSPSFGFTGNSASNFEKTDTEKSDKPVAGFVINKSDKSSNGAKPGFPAFEVGVKASDTSKKPLGNPDSSENSKEKINGSSLEKENTESKGITKSFTPGNSTENFNAGSFNFGTSNSFSTQKNSFSNFKFGSTESTSGNDVIATSSAQQFSFGATPSVSINSTVSSGQNTFAVPGKATFTFEQKPLSGQLKSPSAETFTAAPPHTTATITTTTTATTTDMTAKYNQPGLFTFGQQPKTNAAPDTGKEVTSPVNQTNQPTIPVSFAGGLDNNSSQNLSSKNLFSFGQKSETFAPSGNQDSAVLKPTTFGSKPDTDVNKTQADLGKTNGNLFSNEAISQAPTQSNAVSGSAIAPGLTATTETKQTLVQSPPASTATPFSTFPQTSTTFGSKLAENPLSSKPIADFGQTNVTFGSNKSLSFGSSITGFGKTTSQTGTTFTTSVSNTPAFSFGVPNTTQTTSMFNISQTTQSAPTFGAFSSPQTISGFGSATTSQGLTNFITSTSNSLPSSFGVSTTPQSTSTFGISTTQSAPTFGASTTPQSTPNSSSATLSTISFGTNTTQVTPAFGVSSQTKPLFGTLPTTQTTSAFTLNTNFGLSSQPSAVFGAPTSTQSGLSFGSQTTKANTTFGASSCFSTTPSTLPSAFGAPAATSTTGFPASSSFENKPIASLAQTQNIFTQNSAPTFSSASTLSSTQNNIFGQKPATESSLFSQSKTSGFPPSTQSFGSQNQFTFGMSTANATTFTTSPPITTTSPVFNFGGSSSGNVFSFGSGAAGANTTQAPFSFKSSVNEPFKFGATMTTATTTAIAQPTPTAAFSFSSQMNSNPVAEQKTPFSFVASTSASGFNFGSAPSPSPSVFSFGGSTSSASSGSNFNFATPTSGVSFGQTPSPGAPFSVPGTFNIGSGSSQSRPRASSRPRRRP